MSEKAQTVVVLGASDKPQRYSNRAIRLLVSHGHRVIPIHPRLKEIERLAVRHDLGDIHEPVDTLTLYVGEKISTALHNKILALKPARVIFNPGSENPALEKALQDSGIAFEHACTLVLLNTGQF